jgi:hypothetical protein
MRFLKYLTEGGGRFSYSSDMDADNHRTLQSLVKSNNGIFKSMKQRWFLLEKRFKHRQIGGKNADLDSSFNSKKMRGFSGLKKGDYLVEINAYMVFGQKGAGQGTRRIEWGYVVDDVGVREKYKYGFSYSEGGHASQLETSKTKQEWKRDENDAVKEFRELVAQEDMNRDKKVKASNAELMKSEYVGVIGERMKGVEIEVLRKHEFESTYGWTAITVMKDKDGNMIQHFGKNNLKIGDKKKVDFTVKGHEPAKVNKWNKVPYKLTSVNRVKG